MRHFGVVAVLVAGAILTRPAAAQVGSPPARQALFTLDFGQLVGDFPRGVKPLTGSLEVVEKDGARMLRAAAPSEFLITLSEVLPPAFTVEFALIPKHCCNPEDLGFEGTATMNRGTASAQVLWSRERLAVIGGGEMYQGAMPTALAGTLPGQLSTVVVTFDSTEAKLYTNGQRLFTLADHRFMRGRVLRVFLGGQDDGDQAVFLAGLRITAGATAPTVLASQPSGSTGSLPSAGSAIRPAGTGTIATQATTAVTTMTPQTGTLATVSNPMAPVINDIVLTNSNYGAVIQVGAHIPASWKDPEGRDYHTLVFERRRTDDLQACPEDMLAEVDVSALTRSRCWRWRTENTDGDLEQGASYTYRVGAIYGFGCVGCDVVYASLPYTITTPALLIGKGTFVRTGLAVTSVEPRNVQVTRNAGGLALITWTAMGLGQANPNVPGEREWGWSIDQWMDGVPSTCPAPGVWIPPDASNCIRWDTLDDSRTWAAVASGTAYLFRVTSVFQFCDPAVPHPWGSGCTYSYYSAPPVAYQTPVYFTPERPVRGSVAIVVPPLFLQARQGRLHVPYACTTGWVSQQPCAHRDVNFVWAPDAKATAYTFALDEVNRDYGWGPSYVGIGLANVPAGPAPGVLFSPRAGSTVRACLTVVGNPIHPLDPRKGECLVVDVDPEP